MGGWLCSNHSWVVKGRGGKRKQLSPVKERREKEGRDEGRRLNGRQGQGWRADKEATEGGKVPTLGRRQRFETWTSVSLE